MRPSRFLLLALAGGLLAAPAAHAQGLGGVLNQAKAKAQQAGSRPVASASQAATAATQAGPPHTPPELNAQTNAEYTTDLMAYATRQVYRPGEDNYNIPSEIGSYCRLRQEGFPVRVSWDQAAIAASADNRTYLTAFINDLCGDLVGGLTSIYGDKLKLKLAKVKEIHFTTSPKKRSLDDKATLGGYFFRFDPATGVLQAPMSEPDGVIAISQDLALTKWIVAHVQ